MFDQLSLGLDAIAFLRESEGYAEKFFQILGASHITSFDKSDYQVATCLHDMNAPIEGSLKNRFSVVLDSGTLEHVFNFPQAIRNCMEMVKVGGHFIQITVANDFIGHGFYQFTPELMYRVFVGGQRVCDGGGRPVYEDVWRREMVPDARSGKSQAPRRAHHKESDLPVDATRRRRPTCRSLRPGPSKATTSTCGRCPARNLRRRRQAVPARDSGGFGKWCPQVAVRAIRQVCGPGVNSAVDRLTDEAVIRGRF